MPPVAERVEACKKFLERAKRRVARAEEVINRAQEQRVINMEEVEEAEKRMLVLQAEAAHPPPSSLPEVGELQRQIAELIRERDLLRQSVSTGVPNDIPDLTNVLPMPTNPQDLEGWISNRNCELRNALEFGDVASTAKIGTLLSQGAASLASMIRDVPMEGKSRSTLMSSLIDEADAKRRCLDASTAFDVAIQSRQSNVRNARYGYRGVRVGEASHPGPSHHSSAPDDVLDSLELTLQRIEWDTDDEPLVRPSNRNVAQTRSIEDAPSRVPIIATEEDESMMPSSTIPASSGRVRAAHGCLRRTVLEGVQRAERLTRMPPRTRVDSSSLRQGGWVVDIAEGDSEDDGEDPGRKQKFVFRLTQSQAQSKW